MQGWAAQIGNIGAILMASGTPATATMDQVSEIAAA